MILRTWGMALALALAGCGGSSTPPDVAPQPSAQSSDSDPEPALDTSPTIDVIAAQPTEILLDGKPIGTTPISGYKVSPGSHEVTFVDDARGNRTMMVTVDEGDAKTVTSDPVPPIREDKPEETDKKK